MKTKNSSHGQGGPIVLAKPEAQALSLSSRPAWAAWATWPYPVSYQKNKGPGIITQWSNISSRPGFNT